MKGILLSGKVRTGEWVNQVIYEHAEHEASVRWFVPMQHEGVDERARKLQALAFRQSEEKRAAVERLFAGAYLAAEFAAGLDE